MTDADDARPGPSHIVQPRKAGPMIADSRDASRARPLRFGSSIADAVKAALDLRDQLRVGDGPLTADETADIFAVTQLGADRADRAHEGTIGRVVDLLTELDRTVRLVLADGAETSAVRLQRVSIMRPDGRATPGVTATDPRYPWVPTVYRLCDLAGIRSGA